jgi:hypothetical protein
MSEKFSQEASLQTVYHLSMGSAALGIFSMNWLRGSLLMTLMLVRFYALHDTNIVNINK